MATIIKSDGVDEAAAGDAVRPAVFTYSDMGAQGDDYVRAVKAEAAKAVQQANAEAAAIRTKAEEEGRRVAETAILELIDRRLADQMVTIRPALDAAIAQIVESRGDWLAHWEEATMRLAASIAERIVRRELTADPTILRASVRDALTLAAGCSEVTVFLHPLDHKRIAEHVGPLSESIERVATPRFVADESLEPGDCRVETEHGSIDQRVRTQLDRLVEELG